MSAAARRGGELERFARDRPQVTRELHLPSAFYGHAAVLKRYAGLPSRRRLKVAIEHGISLTDFVWDADVHAVVPTFMCASPGRAERYAELASPERAAVAIGPMILYTEPSADRPAAAQLVAFPAHSTHHVDAVYDVERFARRLERYRSDWDEVVVCVYWRDVLRGAHRAYAERGFTCVTAGHMYDPRFLQRLRGILDGATLVASNEIGSFLFYAVALGRPVWVRPDAVEYRAESRELLERDRADEKQWADLSAMLCELFAEERREVSAEQRRTVDALAGLSSHRSPDELRALLRQAEDRYRALRSPLARGRDAARSDAVRALSALRVLRDGR